MLLCTVVVRFYFFKKSKCGKLFILSSSAFKATRQNYEKEILMKIYLNKCVCECVRLNGKSHGDGGIGAMKDSLIYNNVYILSGYHRLLFLY